MNSELIETMRDPAERLARRIRDILGPYNDDEESLQVLVSSLVLKLDDMQAAASAHDTEEFIAIHRTYNAQAADSGVVPVSDLRAWMAGHARVPVEPTEAMLDAAINACAGKMYPQDLTHGPQAEPVAYQSRMRPSWSEKDGWTSWEECSKGTFEDYKRVPINGDWHYEARALYEHAPKPQALPQGVEDAIHGALTRHGDICRNLTDDLISSVSSAISGMAIVPVEPTEAMLVAARDWSHKKYSKPIGNDAAQGCWKAMLAATKEKGE